MTISQTQPAYCANRELEDIRDFLKTAALLAHDASTEGDLSVAVSAIDNAAELLFTARRKLRMLGVRS